jgi:TonB-linked SusC/RagA family outer membrane protein
MYKLYTVFICRHIPRINKNFLLIMKLTLVLLILGMMQVSASTSAQNVNLSVRDVSLKKVFKELRQQTGFNFLYNSKMLNETTPVSMSVKNMPFNEVLDKCFNNQPVTYVIVDNTIVVKRKPTASAVQEIAISGIVKDDKGGPLPGVSVRLKGTPTGTVTDVNGNYHLTAANGSGTLVFSFIGFQTQEIAINNAATINVVLKEQPSSLNEVVVTALGIKRSEQSLTYATQQVSSNQINQVKTDNLMNALNGKVAGLTISPSSSGVGGSDKIILRGSRSANGNNQPLYVIDGIPILNSGNTNGQPGGTFGGSTDGGDGISNLNPEDIESISVLEGASAAALYGSQAQNGVILVTTKKGKAGKATINFTSSFTGESAAYTPKFQNSYGQSPGSVSGDVTSWGAPISKTEDNLKDFFQTGTNWTNAINLSAGSENAQTYFSYANTHATGIEPGNKLDRNNFNLRETGSFLNNKLTVDGSVNYINQEIDNSPQLGIYSNPLVSLYNFPRGVDITPFKENYEDPTQVGAARQNWITQNSGDLHQDNPWWIINREPNMAKRNRLLLSGSVKYEFTKWLNVQVRGNVDRISDDFEQDFYSGSNSLYNSNETGALKLGTQTVTQKYGDVLLNFMVPLQHSDFKINGLIGASVTDQQTQGYAFNGNLQTPDFFTAGNIISALGGNTANTTLNSIATNVNSFAVAPNHNQLQAIFGSADFSYKNWAYLTVTGRNDWSSNLSFTNNDSYFYPSAGLSIILSQALQLPQDISYAKLRATFAQVGNTIPNYLTNIQNTQNGSGSLVFNTAQAPSTLKPEKTNSLELGTDLRFFDNRLNFSFTYYKTNTLNQYVPITPPTPSLISIGYVNAGNIQNSGLEFTLGYDVFRGSDFNWNTSFNGSMNKNKIIDVDSRDGINTLYLTNDGNGYQSVLTKGGAYGDIYAPTVVRDAQGRVVLTGDGTAASPYTPQKSNSYNFVGNPNPKFQLGWSNSFNYKKLSLSFLVDGKFGGQVMSITQGILDANGVSQVSGDARNAGGVKINGVNSAGQAVTTVNAQSWYQTIGQRGAETGEYMYSATVVRLREAALGYTWPITHGAFKSIKLSLIGRNLIYFYKKAPFDPEVTMSTGNGLSGIDVFNQPATRNVGLNLNVNF